MVGQSGSAALQVAGHACNTPRSLLLALPHAALAARLVVCLLLLQEGLGALLCGGHRPGGGEGGAEAVALGSRCADAKAGRLWLALACAWTRIHQARTRLAPCHRRATYHCAAPCQGRQHPPEANSSACFAAFSRSRTSAMKAAGATQHGESLGGGWAWLDVSRVHAVWPQNCSARRTSLSADDCSCSAWQHPGGLPDVTSGLRAHLRRAAARAPRRAPRAAARAAACAAPNAPCRHVGAGTGQHSGGGWPGQVRHQRKHRVRQTWGYKTHIHIAWRVRGRSRCPATSRYTLRPSRSRPFRQGGRSPVLCPRAHLSGS